MFFGGEDVRKVILKSLICYSDWAGLSQQYKVNWKSWI
jgi:hypothetical protein